MAKPTIVIVVKDRGTANAPIDVGKRLPVSGATVELADMSARPTDADGKAVFELDPQTKRGTALTVKVSKKDEYHDQYTFIPAADVPTTPTTLEWIVELDRIDVVKEKIDTLTGKIKNTCGEVGGACTDLENLSGIRDSYQREMDKLTEWIRNFGGKVENAYQECLTCPARRSEIQNLANTVRTKAGTLRMKLSTAEAKANACRTKADAQELKNLWQELVSLSWEVYNAAKPAFEKQAVLKGIIARANVIRDRFDKADPSDQPISLSLADLPNRFGELQRAFKLQRDTTYLKAFSGVKEKRKVCADAYNSAVQEIDKLHATTDPRVGQFKTSARNLIPAEGRPCDEEMNKKGWDRLVELLGELVTSSRERGNELRSKPLCGGESNADNLVTQIVADQAVLSDLRASTIPQKIQQCEKQPSVTPPVQPPSSVRVSISGPAVAKVGETVTLTAEPSGTQYRYDWVVDGQRSLSKTGNSTVRVPLTQETPKDKSHLFSLKVTDVQTNRYLGEATHRLRVEKNAPTNITLTLDCPESARAGDSVTCKAKPDAATRSSLGNMQGAWGYWWYVNKKAMQTTNETMSFPLPAQGAEVTAVLVKAPLSTANAQQLARATKTVTVAKPPADPNLDKPFGQPQYLIHQVDKDSKDSFFLFGAPPDKNLNLLLPDGYGGTRGIKVADFSGPFKTGREVCAAAGSKVGSLDLNAWNSWTYFSCQGSSR